MKQDNNYEINKAPNIHWEKFLSKFSEIDTTPTKDWKIVHLIAYWCVCYKNHYNIIYSIRFNSTSPSKSYEIWQFRKLGQIISSDPEILKDYIDWFFVHKIILKKKRITSLSFLTDTNVANEYKFKKLGMDNAQNIDRTTTLPPNLIELISKLNINCKTYGDLAFIKRVVNTNMEEEDENKKLLDLISKTGFDLSVLEKVK